MGQKRAILDALPRAALLELVDAFEVEVADRRVRDQLLDALAASKKARLDLILEGLPRAALKDICRALGLSQSGKEKSNIIERILSGGATDAAPPPPAATSRPTKQQLSESLTRDDLLSLLDAHELAVQDRQVAPTSSRR